MIDFNANVRPEEMERITTPALAKEFIDAQVEAVRAHAGLDIGGTLIGMHLRAVAVPVRLQQKRIGEASILAARTRPKFIGGIRACYDETKL